MTKKKKSDEQQKQLSSIDTDLIKEFSSFSPPSPAKKPYDEQAFLRSLADDDKPEKLPEYLKEIFTTSGQNMYELTLKIILRIKGGLIFSEAVESLGENHAEIKQIALQHTAVLKAINFAQAKEMQSWIDKIKRAADKDWRAASFYLERRYTYNFSELKNIVRDDSMPIKKVGKNLPTFGKDVKELSDEELMAELEKNAR
jgi:hypothetical protein